MFPVIFFVIFNFRTVFYQRSFKVSLTYPSPCGPSPARYSLLFTTMYKISCIQRKYLFTKKRGTVILCQKRNINTKNVFSGSQCKKVE